MRQLELFSALQSSTEGIDTEFKSARGGMPGGLWEPYAAMANTHGGAIVLGVAKKAYGFLWEGEPDAARRRCGLHEEQCNTFLSANGRGIDDR